VKLAEEITAYKKTGTTVIKKEVVDEAKLRIETFLRKYLKTHKQVYPSDVADALGLDYELTREIFDILEKEGKLEKKAK
jgi:predicted ArsR family transcriptional regulator